MGTYAHGSDISYSNADAGPRGGLPAAALQSDARQRCDSDQYYYADDHVVSDFLAYPLFCPTSSTTASRTRGEWSRQPSCCGSSFPESEGREQIHV